MQAGQPGAGREHRQRVPVDPPVTAAADLDLARRVGQRQVADVAPVRQVVAQADPFVHGRPGRGPGHARHSGHEAPAGEGRRGGRRPHGPRVGGEVAQHVDLQVGRRAIGGVVGQHRYRAGLPQVGVQQVQGLGEGDPAMAAPAAFPAAVPGEQPVRLQPGDKQRQGERQHDGGRADPAPRGGQRPDVGPLAVRVVLPGVDEPPPQPQPVPAVGREQAQVAHHARAEHQRPAHRARPGIGGQRHAEQHKERQPGEGRPVQAHREQVGQHGDQADPGHGEIARSRSGAGPAARTWTSRPWPGGAAPAGGAWTRRWAPGLPRTDGWRTPR